MWNRTENQITLFFIRHGKTPSNQEKRYLGKTDEPLSREGREELRRKREQYRKADILFASPMKRCIETAEILYPLLTPVVIDEWREIDFGAFEGKNYLELQSDKQYKRWIESGGTLPFPKGESREEFVARSVCGFRKMTEYLYGTRNDGRIKSAAAVVHGGTVMALFSALCGGGYFDYQAANGDGYECVLQNTEAGVCIRELKSFLV